jgi:hypothetical protein
MNISFSNVLGLLVFLVLGLFVLWAYHRFLYPLLSARHEKAKVTGTQGQGPWRMSRVMYVVGLVLIPLAGFLLGGMIWKW